MVDNQSSNKRLPEPTISSTSVLPSDRSLKSKIQITTVNKAGQVMSTPQFPKLPAPVRVYKATGEVVRSAGLLSVPISAIAAPNSPDQLKTSGSVAELDSKKATFDILNKSRESASKDVADEVKVLTVVEYREFSCLFKGVGLGINTAMLVVAIVYIAGSLFCSLDERGTDVYFDGLAGEYDLPQGLMFRELDLHAHDIKTQNWGYFQTAFKDAWGNTDSVWKDYDCFLTIVMIGCLSGLMWVAACSLNIHALRRGWATYGCKSAVFSGVIFVLFLCGNAYIMYRIYLFNDKFADAFDACKCSAFKADYYRSITYYFFLACGVCFFGLLQLVFSVALCCKSSGSSCEAVPEESSSVQNGNSNNNSGVIDNSYGKS